MTKGKYNDAITIREIEYAIHLKDKDSELHELATILRSELTRFEDIRKKNENQENPIRDFLKTNIERSIVIRDNTRVYFLNYQEKGALTIRFTLLVITRYINYGTIRQALDNLIKDTIGDYFEELLERHVPVSVTVRSDDKELYEIPSYTPSNEPQPQPEIAPKPKQRDYLPIILASAALILTFSICLILVFRNGATTPEANKPADEYKDKYYELLIEKQVKDVLEKERFNSLLFKKLESGNDSIPYLKLR